MKTTRRSFLALFSALTLPVITQATRNPISVKYQDSPDAIKKYSFDGDDFTLDETSPLTAHKLPIVANNSEYWLYMEDTGRTDIPSGRVECSAITSNTNHKKKVELW